VTISELATISSVPVPPTCPRTTVTWNIRLTRMLLKAVTPKIFTDVHPHSPSTVIVLGYRMGPDPRIVDFGVRNGTVYGPAKMYPLPPGLDIVGGFLPLPTIPLLAGFVAGFLF